MASFIAALIFLLIALSVSVIQKTYNYVPTRELRRRASQHDPLASQLYRAVAYGESLELLLALLMIVPSAAGFILLARIAPVWLSLAAVIVLLWLAFALIPSSRVTAFGGRLTLAVTPALAALLGYLEPVFGRSTPHLIKRRRRQPHSGLFEHADILELVEQLQEQEDSRFSPDELVLMKRVLELGHKTVGQVMTSLGTAKPVHAGDTIGPVLIDELHRADSTYVPVVEENGSSQVIGLLSVPKLGLHSSGRVQDHMETSIYYVHQDDSLTEALQAFETIGCPACLVVDQAGETVGLVSLKSVLAQLLGTAEPDAIDLYTDREAVAHRHTPAPDEIEQAVAEVDTEPSGPQDENQETLSETDQTVVE
jgi:CBS domain containing-hemolysin-like protein